MVTRVTGPDQTVLTELQAEAEIASEGPDEWLHGVSIPSALRFPAEVEGTYTVEFEIAGSTAAFPIHVRAAEPS
jgi:hypothetical protein